MKTTYYCSLNKTVMEILSNPIYSIFFNFIKEFNLDKFLLNGKYTIFVPSNESLSELPTNILTNKILLQNILLYHIVEGIIDKKYLKNKIGCFIPTISGNSIFVDRLHCNTILVDLCSNILHINNIQNACDGIIYSISNVLLPIKMYTQDPIIDSKIISKYEANLVIPPAIPITKVIQSNNCCELVDYYEIEVRQFDQQILPLTMPKTTVWGYGLAHHPDTFNYPSFSIESVRNRKTRIRWINKLVNSHGYYLPHLLPVDPTLHWANYPGGKLHRDSSPFFGQTPPVYMNPGPVPLVTHLHGAEGVGDESDGYPESWFLPCSRNINPYFAKVGTYYNTNKSKFEKIRKICDKSDCWKSGSSTSQYPNTQRATTLWFHDHTLGMTRINVYAGPSGFYLLRESNPLDPDYIIESKLPKPSPKLLDPINTKYYEIPIVIQDRMFNVDGSLFYPDNRAYFEGLDINQLKIPFIGSDSCQGKQSDISPIWNPEFFGNVMVTNGKSWPKLQVEARRYRFRYLNGCNSRFLILKLTSEDPNTLLPDVPSQSDLHFWQIGNEGGFLPNVIELESLLIAPAERFDVIVDFTEKSGNTYYLVNDGPDSPFGGGTPGIDFPISDSATTRQIMRINVIDAISIDASTLPSELVLAPISPLPVETKIRQVSLNEKVSQTVFTKEIADDIVLDCTSTEPFGPQSAVLGIMVDGFAVPKMWDDSVTENPDINSTEIWEIYNFTADAHPIHIHEVLFEILNRQQYIINETGRAVPDGPLINPTETGRKDTVISYPNQITRIKIHFTGIGLFVWHCHILEHEDNEMMRPYIIGPMQQSSFRSTHK